MGQRNLTWGEVVRYCHRHNYVVRDQGGDKLIIAPKNDNVARSRHVERIGHTSSRNSGTNILPCYISKLERLFGVAWDKIKEG